MPLTKTESTIYSGAATLGRIRVVIGAIIACIIAIILFLVGGARLRDPRTAVAPGTVAHVSGPAPVPPGQQTPMFRNYTIVVKYAVGGRAYTSPPIAHASQAAPAVGSAITVRYNPADPSDGTVEDSPRVEGWALIGLGAVIAAGAIGWAVLSFRYKALAATEGAAAGIGMIARAL